MSDILDDLDSPWPADYALQPKNSSERYDVIHAQEVKRQAAAEILRLREQVAALTKERDDYKHDAHCCNIEFNDVRYSYAHFKAMSETQAEQIAALAEQNEKMKDALTLVKKWNAQRNYIIPYRVGDPINAAISLPDIAAPAINRIKREGMLAAAEICETVELPIDIEVWLGTKKALTSATAIGLATTIRARADELYPEVKP